ncbi:hypothetical protein X801_05291, partial [Opisthorchis viverrini]
VNLIEFPETPSGHTGELQSIEGRCIDGAVQLNNSKVTNQAFCLPNGKWRLYSDAHCVCNAGYELHSGGQRCEACAQGTYKVAIGNSNCLLCPMNSISSGPGQVTCDCLPGYFRMGIGTLETEAGSCYGYWITEFKRFKIRAQNAYGTGPLSSPIRLWRPHDLNRDVLVFGSSLQDGR